MPATFSCLPPFPIAAHGLLLTPPPPVPLITLTQAKKLEDIRSEAQAELGIVDVPIAGLEALPGAQLLPPLAAKRPEEVELFPGGCHKEGEALAGGRLDMGLPLHT